MRVKRSAWCGLLFILGLFLWIQGCRYFPEAVSGKPIQRVAIPVFQNDTFEPALEGKLTRMVKQEFLTRQGFRIVQDPAQAQLILEGRISSFGLQPLSFDAEHRVAEYRVNIGTEVKIRPGSGKPSSWQQERIQGSAEFAVNPDPGVSRSVQDLAIEEAAKRIAEQIWFRVYDKALNALRTPPGNPQ